MSTTTRCWSGLGLMAAVVVMSTGACKSKPAAAPTPPATAAPADPAPADAAPPDPAPPDPASPDRFEVLVGELEGHRDRACACPDAACTTAVRDEASAWLHVNLSEVLAGDLDADRRYRRDTLVSEFGACVRRFDPPPPEGAELLLYTMRRFTDAMCACSDARCIELIERKMIEWMMKNADAFRDVKPTKAQDAEADRLQERMEECKSSATAGS